MKMPRSATGNYLQNFLETYDPEFSRDDGKAFGSLGDWAVSTPIILDGKPFTFARHEYLIEPYRDPHPDVVEVKAAQMGLTTKSCEPVPAGC